DGAYGLMNLKPVDDQSDGGHGWEELRGESDDPDLEDREYDECDEQSSVVVLDDAEDDSEEQDSSSLALLRFLRLYYLSCGWLIDIYLSQQKQECDSVFI
ncbi:MAG: hypothetical protein EZS28_049813, partial [Streblomastix strix]